MRAAVFVSPRTFEVREAPDLVLEPGEVLIRNQVSGICGSDIHLYADRLPRVTPLLIGKVMGHELCGEVVAVAPDVANVTPGDRVAVEPLVTCRRCPLCMTGDYHLCPDLQHIGMAWSGGFGEYAKAPATNVYRLPETVSYEDASLLDCLAVGLHAIHRTGVHAGSSVLVMGGGTIGLATAQAAKWAGASMVAVATRSALAREMAPALGIDVAIDTTGDDLGARVNDLTGGRGPDIVFDAVGGSQRYVQRGIDLVRRGGKIGVIGDFPEQRVDLTRDYLRKEVDLIACFSYAMWGPVSEFQLALDGLAAGRLSGRQYITQRFPLDEIGHAFEVAEHVHGQDAVKVSIVF